MQLGWMWNHSRLAWKGGKEGAILIRHPHYAKTDNSSADRKRECDIHKREGGGGKS